MHSSHSGNGPDDSTLRGLGAAQLTQATPQTTSVNSTKLMRVVSQITLLRSLLGQTTEDGNDVLNSTTPVNGTPSLFSPLEAELMESLPRLWRLQSTLRNWEEHYLVLLAVMEGTSPSTPTTASSSPQSQNSG